MAMLATCAPPPRSIRSFPAGCGLGAALAGGGKRRSGPGAAAVVLPGGSSAGAHASPPSVAKRKEEPLQGSMGRPAPRPGRAARQPAVLALLAEALQIALLFPVPRAPSESTLAGMTPALTRMSTPANSAGAGSTPANSAGAGSTPA